MKVNPQMLRETCGDVPADYRFDDTKIREWMGYGPPADVERYRADVQISSGDELSNRPATQSAQENGKVPTKKPASSFVGKWHNWLARKFPIRYGSSSCSGETFQLDDNQTINREGRNYESDRKNRNSGGTHIRAAALERDVSERPGPRDGSGSQSHA